MLIVIITFGRNHEKSHVIFGPGHTTSSIKSEALKFSQVGMTYYFHHNLWLNYII